MTFNELHSDIGFNCIKDAIEDNTNEFVRRLKKETLNDNDFKSHWERGIRPPEMNCESICSHKGISINLFNDEHIELIINKYKTTFSINPKRGAYLLLFKLKKNAGVVKRTPTKNDLSHCNLFKADNFSLDKLEITEIVKFA